MPVLLLLNPLSAATDATATPAGLTASMVVGTAAESLAASPSGLTLTSTLTTATPAVEALPTGLAGALTVGAVAEAVGAAPAALAATFALASPVVHVVVAPDGQALATSVGAPTAEGDGTVAPTGQPIAAQVGTAIESIAATPAPLALALSLGDSTPAVEAIPDGQPATLTLGAVTATGDAVDATAAPDGLALGAALGDVDASAVDNTTTFTALPSAVFEFRGPPRHEPTAPVRDDASTAPRGLSLVAVAPDAVEASGDAVADPPGVATTLAIGRALATGTQNPTDEELVMLCYEAAA